ncbi:MAG: 1-deoxy-D-xylulose-5-phosphate reductoisomerase [Oleispira antarctica]|uniref:1-deoxy-D-xylulose 5-phosphate reductoisomerase n=1 Tax=Oleispira antarctica RB-8 TaxID=698738 RepID=R4YPL9_OLEAN|nr:1-deoxy-D-xylulose-5-phosphate reductoisomerase [Oleispira antarctica]MBQ0791592.1 1-deoxy-D-xylulose-5-phosphate reductoisomerase [Oleispira antarctica]CCK75198.1 1-deoxy-D-xylulose 5-phosphate reductoisomerase [Oleispira antarctica RB-8]
MSQWITVLGATGSIGSSTLDVIRRHPTRYRVYALTGFSRIEKLVAAALEFSPRFIVVPDDSTAEQARDLLIQVPKNSQDFDCQVLVGEEALARVASDPDVDMVMASIVGAAGLLPTLAAAKAGKRVLLANKEALVMAGPLFMQAIRDNGAELLPIDSEHNAIFQSLPANYQGDFSQHGIEKILLTASGGPFRNKTKAELVDVTPAEAVAHPNWSMGAKISVDCATLMNKGLELIEACFLFNCRADQIQVVVHPQSVIHSMVQYNDGSVIAELGQPDMRTPIAYGMAWPERIDAGVKHLDLFEIAQLDFVAPDHETFPCLNLAKAAFKRGGISPAVLNAANEIAVAAFLSEQIGFLAIPMLIEKVMAVCPDKAVQSLEDVLAADQWAREQANRVLTDFKNSKQRVGLS